MSKDIDRIVFSTSATLISRLGDELIKDPHTAFFELIKNSYDADATEVHVKFRRTTTEHGTIEIRDNGSGMSLDDLATKWARAGGENKVREPYTPRFNRRRLGAKGIGRFSLAKLGSRVKVITRTPGNPEQLVFDINFRHFTDDKDFNEMGIPFSVGKPRVGFTSGTILEIADLSHRWTKQDVRKIHDQLCHLIDPDRKGQHNFAIGFDCPDWAELAGPLSNPISGHESHLVRFQIDPNGAYRWELEPDQRLAARRKCETRPPPIFGPVDGVIRYYKEGIRSRDRRVAESADESHMGVKLYRDGCRVRPYGEPSDDWLEVKARRARGGGKYYVQAQALAGAIYISASTNPGLVDATNREAGIIENEVFVQFRQFVREQIDALNEILEQETKSESQKQKRSTVKKILDTVVNCLRRQESDVYGGYVDRLDRERRGRFGQSKSEPDAIIDDVKPPTKDEWRCLGCDERWRVLKPNIPSFCMQFAVNRLGKPRDAKGCGSTSLERSKHEMRNLGAALSSVVSGEYALVAGKQVRVRVDYDMGPNDDEYHVDEREILINGSHPAYTVAERLDGMSGKKYEIGDEVFVPALTTHIAKCACLAWAELHYRETQKWTEFKERYESLLSSICESVRAQL